MTVQIDDEKDEKMNLWKEYTDKANNFADWFTAILISNFAYLIGLLDKIGVQLEAKVYLWNESFNATCAALFSIFVVKALGVWAASIRADRGKCTLEKNIERVRTVFIFIFGICGISSLIVTGRILKYIFLNSL